MQRVMGYKASSGQVFMEHGEAVAEEFRLIIGGGLSEARRAGAAPAGAVSMDSHQAANIAAEVAALLVGNPDRLAAIRDLLHDTSATPKVRRPREVREPDAAQPAAKRRPGRPKGSRNKVAAA